jgi:hypothetical protein
MTRNTCIRALLLGTVLCLLAAVGAYAQMPSVEKHPIEVTEAVCSKCHPDKWGQMDHTSAWGAAHRYAASDSGQVCTVCHAQSFCADCHANKEEIKPGDKVKEEPWRTMPHRGDYISLHKIEGKINPAPCFRCHGRTNNERCRVCHR